MSPKPSTLLEHDKGGDAGQPDLQKLVLSERYLASILNYAHDAILSTDMDGKILLWNAAAERLFGYTENEALGQPVTMLDEGVGADLFIDLLAATKENESEIRRELECRRKNGTTVETELSLTLIRNIHGAEIGISIIIHDITDRRRSELVLNETKSHLDLILESAKDFAILSTDIHGFITSWSRGAERIFLYQAKDVLSQPCDIIFTPEDRATDVPRMEMATAAREGRCADERWHVRADGTRFYASGVMAPMRDPDGLLLGFTKIARDMTAQKEIESNLIAARIEAELANVAKTEFLANMSHEIRTPMNAIIGLSTLLAMSPDLTPKLADYVRTLQLSADSLLALINDLLDISKIETRMVELENIPFSLSQMIHEVISIMAVRLKEKGLSFSMDAEHFEHRIFMGDPARLRQIVLNLCSNAVKFTDKGGVHIRLTSHDDVNGREIVCIAVRDSGIGIAADKRASIFERFVQADTSINRKYGGTGLGLAITKTLVEVMGGAIHVESEPGKGSTFTACIPLQPLEGDFTPETFNEDSVDPKHLAGMKKRRVLLVEDYAPNVLVAGTFLEHFGYEFDVANDGIEAFEKIKIHPYFAVLMDVQMHGMNGFDTTRKIREYEAATKAPRLRIIGMTAHALAGDRERCLAAGMDDYMPKPFNPDDLEAKLKAEGTAV